MPHSLHGTIRLLPASSLALLLLACQNPDGTINQTQTGVLLGGAGGAVLGQAVGYTPEATVIGGAVGAAIGGAIGAQLDQQRAELEARLAGSGAQVVRSGDTLHVILPENVTFPTGSAVVNTAFLPSLAQVARSLQAHPNSTVFVVGHTDNVSSAALNQQLSEERARAVAQILIADGVAPGRITYAGRSYLEPIASNATAEGRAQNRRVEIIITPTQ